MSLIDKNMSKIIKTEKRKKNTQPRKKINNHKPFQLCRSRIIKQQFSKSFTKASQREENNIAW